MVPGENNAKRLSSVNHTTITIHQFIVENLRWSVLQKEQNLNAGAQPEIFQGIGIFVELGHFDKHFIKNTRKKRPRREPFCSFFTWILLKLHFEWNI